MKKARLKKAAVVYVSQSKEAVIDDIKRIGDLQRELSRCEIEMNDKIATITSDFAPEIEAYRAELELLQRGVQMWCESNRDVITDNNKVKTANLITGEVSWRTRPPSVTVRGIDSVLTALHEKKLTQFIRVKEEINKDAILNEPAQVIGVAGITINRGAEDFIITPFEQEIS